LAHHFRGVYYFDVENAVTAFLDDIMAVSASFDDADDDGIYELDRHSCTM